MRHLIIRTLLLSACLVFCAGAAAQPPADPPPDAAATPEQPVGGSTSDRAVELFRQANDLYKQDRYAEAAPLYEQAWQLAQTYDIAANYGHTAYHLQDYRKAAELLSFAVARWPQTGQTPARQAAEERLEELRQHVAGVRVTVDPAGAEVSVDDTVVGTAPLELELFVEPGAHTIAAKLSGFQQASQAVDAQAGATAEVSLTLTPLPSGNGGPTTPDQPQAEPLPLWPTFVAGGVALALAGVGIAFRVVGGNQEEDADAHLEELRAVGQACPVEPGCSELVDMYGDADTSLNTSTGLFVAGGAAAAFAIVWAVAYVGTAGDDGGEGEAAPAAALDVTPLAGPTFVGGSASLRF